MESDLKKKICDYLEMCGYYTYLNIVTNKNGIGDITVLCPGGKVFFIETKQRGKKMSALQQYRSKEILNKVGVITYKMESLSDLKEVLKNGK